MYHTSRYAPQSQVTNPDAVGVEALFTDAVRDYVAAQPRPSAGTVAPATVAGEPVRGADVQVNQTYELPQPAYILICAELAR